MNSVCGFPTTGTATAVRPGEQGVPREGVLGMEEGGR